MKKSFLTMGDSNYFPSIALSAIQAERYHPECIFGIYDWGFTCGEREYLQQRDNVRLINWQDSFNIRPFPGDYLSSIISVLCAASDVKTKAKMMILIIRSLRDYLLKRRGSKEWLLAQKPYCFLDWASRGETEKFVFLDGDAFVMSRVDELFDRGGVGVTLRRENEILFDLNNCQVVNSGVVSFSGTKEINKLIIQAWIDQMQKTSEYLVEQTALTRMILGYSDNGKTRIGSKIDLEFDNNKVVAELLDCEIYNFNWIEEGVDPNKNKIVHFKGGRHSGERFVKLAKTLGLENELAEVMQWHKSDKYNAS